MRKTFLALASVMLLTACQKADDDPAQQPTPTDVSHREIPCVLDSLGGHVLAFYPFSGGSVNDFSGNGHHLSNSGGAVPVADRKGNPGCAYEFHNDPTTLEPAFYEYLSIDQTGFLNNLNEFSISLWYQPLDTSIYGVYPEGLVSRGNDYFGDRIGQWSLGIYDCRRAVFARTNTVWEHPGTDTCLQIVQKRVGRWTHAVATFQKKGSLLQLYIDGKPQGVAVGDIINDGVLVTSRDIGSLFLGYRYKGRLDDVILFDKALTPTEVGNLYHTATCCQ